MKTNYSCTRTKQPFALFFSQFLETMEVKEFGIIRFIQPQRGVSNGQKYIQGHVEILHDNVWGTICDDFFDYNNNGANVVCKMAGYPRGE